LCTVTFIRDGDRRLLTMNRDDAPTRTEEPPRIRRTNDISYLTPLDLLSGGTWIGVNAHGVAACLLNRYDEARAGAQTRGAIIPLAMGGRTTSEAAERVERLNHESFSPFTCLILSREHALRLDWNGRRLERTSLADALSMVTSSSWNWEAALFRRTILQTDDDLQSALSAFHCRRDPADDDWAPLMTRRASQTMGVTQIAIEGHELEMRYWSRPSAIARGLTDPDVSISIWSLA
jgi:uncharacterized protein with NRDE domain